MIAAYRIAEETKRIGGKDPVLNKIVYHLTALRELLFVAMKRKNTLDRGVQAEAKVAFRKLVLEINRLRGIYRRHRPQQYSNMPPLDPTMIRTLIVEAKRLRGQYLP